MSTLGALRSHSKTADFLLQKKLTRRDVIILSRSSLLCGCIRASSTSGRTCVCQRGSCRARVEGHGI